MWVASWTVNALLYGIPKYLVDKLQKIQNNSARIITKSKRRDHITPILSALHWLPIEQRIKFKILLTTFKALHGLSPGYIRDLITPYHPQRQLRSLDLSLLQQPRSRTKTFGDRSFAVCAPHLWNSMPRHVRQIDEIESFKTAAKTYLFEEAYKWILLQWLLCTVCILVPFYVLICMCLDMYIL